VAGNLSAGAAPRSRRTLPPQGRGRRSIITASRAWGKFQPQRHNQNPLAACVAFKERGRATCRSCAVPRCILLKRKRDDFHYVVEGPRLAQPAVALGARMYRAKSKEDTRMPQKFQKDKDHDKFIKELKEEKEYKEKDKEKDKDKEKEKDHKEVKEYKEKDGKDIKDKDKEKDHKEIKEIKEYKEKDLKDVGEHKGFKDKEFKEIKEADKFIAEYFPTDPGGPVETGPILEQLTQRVANLEAILARGQAFIQPQERPAVGKRAAKKRAK
jgi:hypothetical protein